MIATETEKVEVKPETEIVIRQATHEDTIGLTEIFMEYAEEKNFAEFGFRIDPVSWYSYIYYKLANDSNFYTAIALDKGEPIGACGAEVSYSWMDSSQLVAEETFWYIKPEYRGKSIAERLINMCEKWSYDKGADIINITVLSKDDEDLPKYYLRKGYRKDGYSLIKRLR